MISLFLFYRWKLRSRGTEVKTSSSRCPTCRDSDRFLGRVVAFSVHTAQIQLPVVVLVTHP